MRTSDSIDKIAPAFVAFQAAIEELPAPDRSTEIDGRDHRWASAAAVADATRLALAVNELSFTTDVRTADAGNYIEITGRCIHASGQWYEWGPVKFSCNPDTWSVGSAISYGCRYMKRAALDIATRDEFDDDGRAAKETSPQAMRSSQAPTDDQPRPSAPTPTPKAMKPASKASIGRLRKAIAAAGLNEVDIAARNHVADLAELTQEHASRLIASIEAEAAK